MGAGPGHVMRAIAAAVDTAPDRAFSVEDLCWVAFPDVQLIEKKHRVAVIRAMWSIVESRSDMEMDRVWLPGKTGRGRLALRILERSGQHPV